MLAKYYVTTTGTELSHQSAPRVGREWRLSSAKLEVLSAKWGVSAVVGPTFSSA